MASKKINCPLVESEIDDEICLDMQILLERYAYSEIGGTFILI